jgi:hypothetical protein
MKDGGRMNIYNDRNGWWQTKDRIWKNPRRQSPGQQAFHSLYGCMSSLEMTRVARLLFGLERLWNQRLAWQTDGFVTSLPPMICQHFSFPSSVVKDRYGGPRIWISVTDFVRAIGKASVSRKLFENSYSIRRKSRLLA